MKRSTLYLKAQRLAPLTVVVGAVACTPMLSSPPDFDVRPVSTQASADVPADQGYYQNAVDAIKQRDYGVALNFLQAARAHEKDSARVLNAFGVVYDKLGRFDLSARYYEKARSADPQSTIVAGNVAYSHVLQQLLNGDITPTQLAAAVPASKPPVVVETQTVVAPDVEMKSPQLAMAPVELRSAPSLAALSLPELNLGTDTANAPVDTKPPQLAMVPLEPRTAPSLVALSLPDLNLDTDTGDRTVAVKPPQLAMVPIEARSALSLAAIPLTHFDFGTDTGDRSVDTQRPVREAAVTPPALQPEWHYDIAAQLAPVAEPQIYTNTSAQDFTFAPPPIELVAEASNSGSNEPASKPAEPHVLADLGSVTQQTRVAAPQPASPNEYLPLFLPDSTIATPPRTEVEDVPQYHAQLAAEFSTERPEKPAPHAAVTRFAAAKRPIVALRVSPAPRPEARKQAVSVQVAASRTPAHAALSPVAPTQHSAAAVGGAAHVVAIANTGILTHHPLVIVNASTKKNADDSIRVTLARRNWSIAPSHATELRKLTYTTLFYAQVDYPVARALARTLTFPIRLVPDSCHCTSLRLVVGDNALSRNVGELHGTSSARAASSVAGVLSGTLQGARGW